MEVVGCMEYRVSCTCQTEYSSLADFASAPILVYFVHKALEHREVDHMEVDHKEVDHTESSDHIGRMDFVKKIDHTIVGKFLVASVATIAMIVGKILVGIGKKSIVAAVSKALVGVE